VADILRGEIALDGASPIIYDTEPTLADRKEVATVGYVLDTVSGGTVAFDSQTIAGTAGESVVAGNLLYFKTSDQEWYKTDADTAATVEGVQLGIALGSGSDGVAITGGVLISGTYTTTGLTAGALYYAGNTSGAISSSAGTTSRIIGIALSTTKLLLIPRNPQSIKDAQKDALNGDSTPSSTNVFKTKYSGKGVIKQKTSGGTINGATLPVPVYQNKTDNEFYACDANDTAALKFIGFAITNATDGNSIDVQFSGIVSGFTGLSEGEKYYVQDTVGTIGTTIGTSEVLVGVAISETELLIQRGRRYAIGASSVSDFGAGGSTSDITITTGFRPSVIRLRLSYDDSASPDDKSPSSWGVWANGISRCSYGQGLTATSLGVVSISGDGYTFTVNSVSDTDCVLRVTQSGTSPATASYVYEIEGEL
jgi:hypothetical protein